MTTTERYALEMAQSYENYLIVPVEVIRTMTNGESSFESTTYRFVVVESLDCTRITPHLPFEFPDAQSAIEVGKRFVDYLHKCYELQVG